MKSCTLLLALIFALTMLGGVGCEPEDEVPSGLTILPTGKATAYQFGKGVLGEFNPGVDVNEFTAPDAGATP